METMNKNIIVCGVPHYDVVPTPEHNVINTPIIMNDNTNNSNTVLTAEKPTMTALIVELACGRGSRITSTLEKINDYIVIGLTHKANHARYNLARNISKRLFENPTDRAIEEVYDVLVESASIIDAVTNIKQTTTPKKSGVVYDSCVQYAVSTVRGDILRSNRVANALEGCALRMCVSRDLTTGTVIMSDALDKALNKVYAAVRSQAKTNGVDIGGKSNTATKTATKAAILAELLRIKAEDSYQFDVIIGEVRPLSGQ